MKMFWSTCPSCNRPFVVGDELRHAGERLICPFCDNRYLPEDSAAIDERWNAD